MAITKSAKIEAEIEKVKAKIAEQQARLQELEQKKLEAENSEIVEIVRGMSISLADLPLVLQPLRSGASGHGGQKFHTDSEQAKLHKSKLRMESREERLNKARSHSRSLWIIIS